MHQTHGYLLLTDHIILYTTFKGRTGVRSVCDPHLRLQRNWKIVLYLPWIALTPGVVNLNTPHVICQLPKDVSENFTTSKQARKINSVGL